MNSKNNDKTENTQKCIKQIKNFNIALHIMLVAGR